MCCIVKAVFDGCPSQQKGSLRLFVKTRQVLSSGPLDPLLFRVMGDAYKNTTLSGWVTGTTYVSQFVCLFALWPKQFKATFPNKSNHNSTLPMLRLLLYKA